MYKLNIEVILDKLAEERPSFISEDDFKFSLISKICEDIGDKEAALEFEAKMNTTKEAYVDIELKIEDRIYLFELTYRTRNNSYKFNDLFGKNKKIGKNIKCKLKKSNKKFESDKKRLNEIAGKLENKHCIGYSILLTNNDLSWKNEEANWKPYGDKSFKYILGKNSNPLKER